MTQLAPALPVQISTRQHLARTGLAGNRGSVVQTIPVTEVGSDKLVTRRYRALRKKRRKKVLAVILVVLGLLPPVMAIYVVSWLIWRQRSPQKSLRFVRQAIRKLEKGETGVALKKLQEAHFLNPQNADALYWLGMLLHRQGRHDEAAEALEIVSRRSPGLPEVESALVDSHLAIDEPEAALFHAQRLFDAAPYEMSSIIKLAEAFEGTGNLDMAIEALHQAPMHKRLLSAELLEVHYMLGDLHSKAGNPEKALGHFKRVYAKDLTFRDVQDRIEALEG